MAQILPSNSPPAKSSSFHFVELVVQSALLCIHQKRNHTTVATVSRTLARQQPGTVPAKRIRL